MRREKAVLSFAALGVAALGTATGALSAARWVGGLSVITHDYSARLVRINPRNFSVPTNLDVGLGSGAKFALTEIDRLMHAG